MTIRQRLLLFLCLAGVLTFPVLTFASDYSDGRDAVERAAYASARKAFGRAAERGHVKSQMALGLLATKKTDRPPNPGEALGWFLAAQENGGKNLEKYIAQARDSLTANGEDPTVSEGILAHYGKAAVRREWLGSPEDPSYAACFWRSDSQNERILPTNSRWQHAALSVIERTQAGNLVDVQTIFRFPNQTKVVKEHLVVQQMLRNPKSIKPTPTTCRGLEVLLTSANEPQSNKPEVLRELESQHQTGDPYLLYLAGMLSSMGDGPNSADDMIREAAQGGEPEAQYVVAQRFGHRPLGRKWMRLAADGGVALAQLGWIELELTSKSDSIDLEQIDAFLDKAANSEDQYVIARIAAIRGAAAHEQLRRIDQALALAGKADVENWPLPIRIEGLAAVYASAGDFSKAIEYQKRAIRAAKPLKYDLTPLEDRLRRYQSSQPWYGYLAIEYQ